MLIKCIVIMSIPTISNEIFPAECSWNLGDLENGVEWARSAMQAGGGERAGALLAKLLLACDDMNGALVAYDQALT